MKHVLFIVILQLYRIEVLWDKHPKCEETEAQTENTGEGQHSTKKQITTQQTRIFVPGFTICT